MTTAQRSERPRMLVIEKITAEAKDTSSFWFTGDLKAKPGQFVMLWIPGTGLKPFGVSYQDDGRFAVTVRKIGTFTEKLFGMKAGDRLGVQGPYGRGFSGKGGRIVLVGGGYGAAPLSFLADELVREGKEVFFINGAATKDHVLYRERFKGGKVHMIYSTDDGSLGHRGFCTDCLTGLLSKHKIGRVFCCGPEMMLRKAFEICLEKDIPAEFSLERHLKCGFGVCGSCCLDGTGWRVCREGPVFALDDMKKIAEFGQYKRDASGRVVKI